MKIIIPITSEDIPVDNVPKQDCEYKIGRDRLQILGVGALANGDHK